MALFAALGLVLVIFIFIGNSLKVVPQGSIAVVHTLGKVDKTYKPGLVFIRPFIDRIIYLKIGMIGTATSESTLEIDKLQFDVKYTDSPRIGSLARIQAFDDLVPIVTQSNIPTGNRSPLF